VTLAPSEDIVGLLPFRTLESEIAACEPSPPRVPRNRPKTRMTRRFTPLPGTEICFVRFLDGRADLCRQVALVLSPASAGLFFG